jgi:hypothetical protein
VRLYVVEHRLGDVGARHLEALRSALQEITSRLNDDAADDGGIRYVRSTVIEAEDRCICLFASSSEALVRRANELAQIPVASIALAVDYSLTPNEEDGM